ncbi:MAG: tetratricopeptide repeat protein [Acidobacteria bacterium]|nr:tetratricopeptide repeat protein [Acidobacteriota bacterium]
MNASRKKLLLAAIPLAAGLLVFLSLNKLSAPKPGTPAHPAAAKETAPSKADRIHEKISLEEQLKKNPGHAPILLRLAELSKESGKPDEAASHLRELLRNEPKNVEARLELGRTLYESGDVHGAIEQTKLVLEQDPGHVDALYNLGAIYGNLNQDAKAREYFTRAAAAAPDSESGRRAKESLKQLRP